jgi:hypothetical protein
MLKLWSQLILGLQQNAIHICSERYGNSKNQWETLTFGQKSMSHFTFTKEYEFMMFDDSVCFLMGCMATLCHDDFLVMSLKLQNM